jgi:DNA-binding transcriptional regulator YiaG
MKYKGEAYEAVHQDAVAMYKVGAMSEERMKEYDEMCLVQEGETAYEAEKPTEPSVRVMEPVTA